MSLPIPASELEERLFLTVLSANGSIRRSFPKEFSVLIGRDEGCHVCAPSKAVSRRHVSLRLETTGITVSDESSTGTIVDGLRLHRMRRTFERDALTLSVGPYVIEVLRGASPRVDGELRRRIHEELLERLELGKIPLGEEASPELRSKVERILGELVESFRVPVEGRASLAKELLDEALGLGPLESLLADGEVAEIMVVDASTIYVERQGKLELTGRRFSGPDTVRGVLERIVSPLGRRIDESNPMVDARLPDGSRVNAVIPPLALKGPTITIRKFRGGRFQLRDLIDGGSLSREMASFLARAVRTKRNIVVAGGTGSGKTTLLNLLSQAIGEHDRVVTIEDATELRLGQAHVVSLEARPPNLEGRGEVAIRDLLKNALRMRPDRILVGECRGGEALDMLQAMNTGHEGSMTTTHANSPREAVARLETLCLMAGLDLPVAAIRRQIASSIHLLVQQSRLSSGARKVTSITEVVGLDRSGEVRLCELFRYEPEEDGFAATGYLPSFVDRLGPEPTDLLGEG